MWYSTTNAAALEDEKVVGLFAPAVSVTKELIRTPIFKKKIRGKIIQQHFLDYWSICGKDKNSTIDEIELQRAFRSLPWFGGLK